MGRRRPARRRQLLDEAIEANEKLLDRLDDTLARIGAFRDERAAKGVRLREARREVDEECRRSRPHRPCTCRPIATDDQMHPR